MLGLRTQESDKFLNFFRIVQNEAKKNGNTFFFDTQERLEKVIGNCECSELSGWLVPSLKAEAFQIEYEKFNDDKLKEDYVWVSWKIINDSISISFEKI